MVQIGIISSLTGNSMILLESIVRDEVLAPRPGISFAVRSSCAGYGDQITNVIIRIRTLNNPIVSIRLEVKHVLRTARIECILIHSLHLFLVVNFVQHTYGTTFLIEGILKFPFLLNPISDVFARLLDGLVFIEDLLFVV